MDSEAYSKQIQHEKEQRAFKRIVRDKSEEAFYVHSGQQSGASFRTLLASSSQRKIVCLGLFLYIATSVVYGFLGYMLVYISFHNIPETSPSHPTSNNAESLYDVGFSILPDHSASCYEGLASWMGVLNLLVIEGAMFTSQLVPFALIGLGDTKGFTSYAGSMFIGIIGKGVLQILTVLPSAQGGWKCWTAGQPQAVWTTEMIKHVRNAPFSSWGLNIWWGMRYGCNDMLYSGHTFQVCMGFLFFDAHLRHRGILRCIRGIIAFWFVIYVACIAICRMHYTIDIVVASALAGLLYTHSPLRFWIWHRANWIVCNEGWPATAAQTNQVELTNGILH